MKEEKTKVHFNDIIESEGKIPCKAYIIGDKVYNANMTSKDQLSTHNDCEKCKQEFEKEVTYDKYCKSCKAIVEQEKFNALELVEWDGVTPLVTYYGGDYFFDIDDIDQYCEDNDVERSSLKLLLCQTSSFPQIDYDYFRDVTHEDWEPSKEMITKMLEFNEFLKNEPTRTWFPTKKRVQLD